VGVRWRQGRTEWVHGRNRGGLGGCGATMMATLTTKMVWLGLMQN
jgi:hypothetical protein